MAQPWTELRVKTGFSDDADWAADATGGTMPAAVFPTGAERVDQQGPVEAVAVFIQFLNASDVPVGAAGDRGKADFTIVEKLHIDEPPRGDFVIDGATVTVVPGMQKVVVGGLARLNGFAVRLTNIVAPTAGTPTKVRVMVREN